jgi:hypothetical protein
MPALLTQVAGFGIAFLFGVNSKFRGILLTYLLISLYAIYVQYSQQLNTLLQLFVGFVLGSSGGILVNYLLVKKKINLDTPTNLEKDDKCFV